MATISTRCTGVRRRSDEVIATPGGQAALYAAVQAVLDPGGHAIVVAPYYATYPGTFRAAGAGFTVVEAAAEDGFQPRAEAIEAAIAAEHARDPDQHAQQSHRRGLFARQPGGASPTSAVEHDLWLLSDEVYWTLGGGEHISPRALPGMAERTLVINSMSKSHGMTGWRIGWLTGPADIITLLISLNLVTTYGLPDFVSPRSDRGARERLRRRARSPPAMPRRRTPVLDEMRGFNNVTVRGSEGGMYVMLDIRAVEPDCERFAWALLDAEQVAVMPGVSFGEAAAGHIRISLCQPEPSAEGGCRRA